MEKKFIDVTAEIKSVSIDSDRNVGIFEGYGSVFGNKDSYGDVVDLGAFKESISQNGLPVMLWQHNPSDPIGVYTEAREDSKGLYLKGEINLDVQKGKEAYSLIKQGAIKGMSIGFYTELEEYDSANKVRRLKKVNLLEVSLVTFPANKLANVIGWKGDMPKTEREFEKLLRQLGYGQTQAKAITSAGFKSFLSMQRDAANGKENQPVQRDADDQVGVLFDTLHKSLATLKELHDGRHRT